MISAIDSNIDNVTLAAKNLEGNIQEALLYFLSDALSTVDRTNTATDPVYQTSPARSSNANA